MNDISEILRALLDKHSNTINLDEEFKQMLVDDDTLRDDYVQWCDEMGYDKATGYRDFINEIMDSQESYWDHYQEFGDEI